MKLFCIQYIDIIEYFVSFALIKFSAEILLYIRSRICSSVAAGVARNGIVAA